MTRENTLDELLEKESPEGNKAKKPKKDVSNPVKTILEGSFLARQRIVKLLPFLMYLTVLGLVYIFNSNFANRTAIKISKAKKQIEEQRFDYVNAQSKLMKACRQTEIVKGLEKKGLKESTTPSKKIII